MEKEAKSGRREAYEATDETEGERIQRDIRRKLKEKGEDEGCLPWVLALVAWMVLVESVDVVAGEEAAGGSDKGLG